MPCVYTFNGWKIYIYYEDHLPPHFHLLNESNDFRVTFDGNLYSVKRGNPGLVDWKYVKQLVRRNQDLLDRNWKLMRENQPLLKLR